MQPASTAAAAGVRSQVARSVPALYSQTKKAAETRLPEWLVEAEEAVKSEAPSSNAKSSAKRDKQSRPASVKVGSVEVKGAHYNLFLGANLPLFSTAQREAELRSMHEVNHRELAIAKVAARVADFLWPNCQENIDEAIAKSKEMAKTQRVHVEEEVYEPPKVPHILPFTNWLRNSKELRESFVCDQTTRYKPRMAWYNPNDGMVPSGWFTEGLLGDLAYYKPFTGLRKPEQRW